MDEPVTVTVAYQVMPGREADFRDWAIGMLREAARADEYLGGGILGPGGTGDDWHIVYRWSDQYAAQRWEGSTVRARWSASASRFTRAAATRRTLGVRAWFDLPTRPSGPPKPPPRWKMAGVTLAAVFPPVLLFNVTVIPFLGGLSVVLRTLALCVAVTGVVNWVMMPRLMRLLKNWLNPPPATQDPAGTPPVAAMQGPRWQPPPDPGAAWRGGDGWAEPRWREMPPQDRDPWDRDPWDRDPRDRDPRDRDPRDRDPRDRDPRWQQTPTELADQEAWYDPRRAAPRHARTVAETGPPAEGRYADRADDSRRAPWYGRQQPWYGRPQDDNDEPEWTPARDDGFGPGRYRR